MSERIYHPASAAGFRLVEKNLLLGPEPSGEDVFRSESDPSKWFAVSVRPHGTGWRGEGGIDFAGGKLRVLPVGGREFVYDLRLSKDLVVRSQQIDDLELASLIQSLPAIGDRARFAPPTDNPLATAPSADQLSTMLNQPVSRLEVEYSDGAHPPAVATARVAENGSPWWILFVAEAEPNPLVAFAFNAPDATIMNNREIPTILGEHPAGPRQAYWTQRHRFWHLATTADRESLLAAVARIQVLAGDLQ
jgi:hypothetical protein